MIKHELIPEEGILVVKLVNALQADDFERLRREVDAHLRMRGNLKGVMICAREFPGWQSSGAMLAHLKFVHDHHRHVARVAIVSDGAELSILPRFAEHFVAAEIRHFDSENMSTALTWLRGNAHAQATERIAPDEPSP
ncbi:MAG TPA: STAS/SEC14 domain-containing protein [Rhodocyclaceae bacterium]|nr:STAS/SEC14 domain-containing protein [Rhodocyclaceae bacterium]